MRAIHPPSRPFGSLPVLLLLSLAACGEQHEAGTQPPVDGAASAASVDAASPAQDDAAALDGGIDTAGPASDTAEASAPGTDASDASSDASAPAPDAGPVRSDAGIDRMHAEVLDDFIEAGIPAPDAAADAAAIDASAAPDVSSAMPDASAPMPDVSAPMPDMAAPPADASAAPDVSPPSPDASNPAPTGKAFVYVGGGSAVSAYTADLATGALTFRGLANSGNNARLAAVDGAGGRAYVHTATSGGSRVFTYQMQANGTLMQIGDREIPYFSNGFGLDQILLSPNLGWLLVKGTASGRMDGDVAAIGADGTPGPLKSLGLRADGSTWDGTGKCLFDLGPSRIDQYAFNPAAGTIAASNPASLSISGGRTITGAAIHPNDKWVYGHYRSGGGDLVVFALDAAKCTLTEQSVMPRPLPADTVVYTSLVVHPSGRFLYGIATLWSGTVSTDWVTIDLFTIDAQTGNLTFVKREQGDTSHRVISHTLKIPAMLPELMIVGGGVSPSYDTLAISVYKVNQQDGTLSSAGARLPVAAGQDEVQFVFPGRPAP